MARKSRDNSVSSQKAAPHWEQILRKFSQAHKEECKSVSLEIPRVHRSTKQFPTGSQYDGTWDVLGMSGHGTYTFPNGVIYEGAFDDGTFHGSGELRYPSGAILRGKWRRGEMYERTLIFAEGLEYSEVDWQYCKMPDRRFAIEYDLGLKPAGESYLTAAQPTREIPAGYYDTGDGFYDPETKAVYRADDCNHIVRSPAEAEQQWIVQNCRMNPLPPLGPRKDLYEKWSEPQIHHPPVVKPAAPSRGTKKSTARVTHEPSAFPWDSEIGETCPTRRRLDSIGTSWGGRISIAFEPEATDEECF